MASKQAIEPDKEDAHPNVGIAGESRLDNSATTREAETSSVATAAAAATIATCTAAAAAALATMGSSSSSSSSRSIAGTAILQIEEASPSSSFPSYAATNSSAATERETTLSSSMALPLTAATAAAAAAIKVQSDLTQCAKLTKMAQILHTEVDTTKKIQIQIKYQTSMKRLMMSLLDGHSSVENDKRQMIDTLFDQHKIDTIEDLQSQLNVSAGGSLLRNASRSTSGVANTIGKSTGSTSTQSRKKSRSKGTDRKKDDTGGEDNDHTSSGSKEDDDNMNLHSYSDEEDEDETEKDRRIEEMASSSYAKSKKKRQATIHDEESDIETDSLDDRKSEKENVQSSGRRRGGRKQSKKSRLAEEDGNAHQEDSGDDISIQDEADTSNQVIIEQQSNVETLSYLERKVALSKSRITSSVHNPSEPSTKQGPSYLLIQPRGLLQVWASESIRLATEPNLPGPQRISSLNNLNKVIVTSIDPNEVIANAAISKKVKRFGSRINGATRGTILKSTSVVIDSSGSESNQIVLASAGLAIDVAGKELGLSFSGHSTDKGTIAKMFRVRPEVYNVIHATALLSSSMEVFGTISPEEIRIQLPLRSKKSFETFFALVCPTADFGSATESLSFVVAAQHYVRRSTCDKSKRNALLLMIDIRDGIVGMVQKWIDTENCAVVGKTATNSAVSVGNFFDERSNRISALDLLLLYLFPSSIRCSDSGINCANNAEFLQIISRCSMSAIQIFGKHLVSRSLYQGNISPSWSTKVDSLVKFSTDRIGTFSGLMNLAVDLNNEEDIILKRSILEV